MMLMEIQWQVLEAAFGIFFKFFQILFISLICYFNSLLQCHGSPAQFSSLVNLSALEWKDCLRIFRAIFCFDVDVATKCHIGIPPIGDSFAVWAYESCTILNFARIYCSGSPRTVQSVWNSNVILALFIAFFDSNNGNVFHCPKKKFFIKDFLIFCAAFVSSVNCWIYIFALSLSSNLSIYVFIHDLSVTVFVASLSVIVEFLGSVSLSVAK